MKVSVGNRLRPGARQAYVPGYVLAVMAGSAAPGMLAGMPGAAQPHARVSEPGQDATVPAATVPAGLAPAGLFITERRLPGTGQQLAVLQAARGAAGRFSAHGDGVRYLRSIFEPAVEVPAWADPVPGAPSSAGVCGVPWHLRWTEPASPGLPACRPS